MISTKSQVVDQLEGKIQERYGLASAVISTTGIVGKFGDDERRLCGCLACHHCQVVRIPWKTSIESSRRLRERQARTCGQESISAEP
jgi:hypothetical protein